MALKLTLNKIHKALKQEEVAHCHFSGLHEKNINTFKLPLAFQNYSYTNYFDIFHPTVESSRLISQQIKGDIRKNNTPPAKILVKKKIKEIEVLQDTEFRMLQG